MLVLDMKLRWVLPHNIDKADFDFSWRPEEFHPMIYQFPTQWQRTGGPALVVNNGTETEYMSHMNVQRLPSHEHWNESLPVVNWDYSWHPDETEPPYIYVWGNQYYSPELEPTITYTVTGATQYKYMHNRCATVDYKPLDVIYVSAGETGEDHRYLTLQGLTGGRVKWVHNVVGRENALKRAAEIAETEWFYCFPGKLMANPDFNFDWQPRRSLGPMHYIFYAENPVNGLLYGHQAAVCYHRELVLGTVDYGLDFTMSGRHDVMPVSSGIAQYDCDPVVTWRTAFREAIKLKYAADSGDSESADRLTVWLTVGEGRTGELSMLGAKHGVEYYAEVNGDPEKLQDSFSWEWLDKRRPSLLS